MFRIFFALLGLPAMAALLDWLRITPLGIAPPAGPPLHFSALTLRAHQRREFPKLRHRVKQYAKRLLQRGAFHQPGLHLALGGV